MPDAFLQSQLDLAILFKSLTLLFMAAVSLAHFMRKTLDLPWKWVALGSLMGWLAAWLELLVAGLGGSFLLLMVCFFLKTLAYLFFLEFARQGYRRLHPGRGPGVWIYLPLLLIACLGIPAGIRGLELSARLTLDVVSMLAMSGMLWQTSRRTAVGTRNLRIASMAILAYSLLQLMDAPAAGFAPGIYLNREVFFRAVHLPIQLVQGLLLLTVDLALWKMLWSLTAFSEDDPLEPTPAEYQHWIVPILLVIFLGGAVLTDYAGQAQERFLRQQLLQKTRTMALSLKPEVLAQQTGTAADSGSVSCDRLRLELARLQQATADNPESLGVIRREGDRVFCLLNSPSAGDHSQACRLVVRDKQKHLLELFHSGREDILTFWKGIGSRVLYGLAPIPDPGTGRVTALLWHSPDPADWQRKVAFARLGPIVATTLFTLFAVGFFISLRWFLEFGRKIAFSEKRYAALFHHLSDGYVYQKLVVDSQNQPVDAVMLDANPAFEKISGVSRDQVLGKRISEIMKFSDKLTPQLLATYARVALEGKPFVEIRYDPVLEKWLRILMYSPAQGYIVTVLQDLTELKSAEEAERRAKEIAEAANEQLVSTNQELEHAFLRANQLAAEAANESKKKFFTEISHRIRTPMTGMIGMLDLVLDQPLPPDQREHLSLARVSAESFTLLLNDLLDLAKLQARELTLENKEFHLRNSLHFCLKTLGMRAQQKSLDLVCDINPDVPEGLEGDALRLRQVLNNLVENAIKHSRQGTILVTVNVEEKNVKETLLHIVVQDSGPGLDPKQEQQLRALLDAPPGGEHLQRLGLAISRQLVEKMSGRMWFENRPNRGVAFHFTARFNRAPMADPSPIRGFQNQRILICERNPHIRRVLEKYCLHWGMRVTLAPDARSAFLAAEVAQKSHMNFAFVLAESQLPDMVLDDFILRLRQERVFRRAAVLLMTSWQRPVEENRFHELGLAGLIMKPVSQSELLDALLAAGISDPSGAYENLAGFSTTRRPLAVLVADNNRINQLLARRILEQWGHKVTIAENGKDVLALLEKQAFDLVLMDVEMPQMDGFEATAVIRYHERGRRRLPIIAVTAQSEPAERQRCLQSGMDAYVKKPIDPLELFKTIEIVLTANPLRSDNPS